MHNNVNYIILCALSLMILLSGCLSQKENLTSLESKAATLKIIYSDKEKFLNQYGNLFNVKYPKVDFEIVSWKDIFKGPLEERHKVLSTYIDQENPDILMLNVYDYNKLSQNQKLFNLDTSVEKDNFDIENIHTGVIDRIKSLGNGHLDGLSPFFSTRALYYNKELFDKYQISYPQDNMSWKEILLLAQRFPNKDDFNNRIFGLYFGKWESEFSNLIQTIGSTFNLSMYDNKGMTINTDRWFEVVEMALQAYESGAISRPEEIHAYEFTNEEDSLLYNDFLQGNAAMTIDSEYLIHQLLEIKNRLDSSKQIDWNVVTIPVDPTNPNITDQFYINEIYSINANSENKEMSWELIKFINSDQIAKILSKTSTQLPARSNIFDNDDSEHNLKAFYKLYPTELNFESNNGASHEFANSLQEMANKEFNKLLTGTQSIKETLRNIDMFGNELLKQDIQINNDEK